MKPVALINSVSFFIAVCANGFVFTTIMARSTNSRKYFIIGIFLLNITTGSIILVKIVIDHWLSS